MHRFFTHYLVFLAAHLVFIGAALTIAVYN